MTALVVTTVTSRRGRHWLTRHPVATGYLVVAAVAWLIVLLAEKVLS